MGIFDTEKQIKRGHQRISENYLKKMGFRKNKQWGAPWKWGKETEHWEKYFVDETGSLTAEMIYFPPTFEGYVTQFNMYGKSPASKYVVDIPKNPDGRIDRYDLEGDANCKFDIQIALDAVKYTLDKINKR